MKHGRVPVCIYVCPRCGGPTLFNSDGPMERAPYGPAVGGLPDDVARLYEEARRALGAGAPTASVLTCRTLLMHIAVDHGAAAGEPFVKYVDFLIDNGVVAKRSEPWLDHVRVAGNRATHRTEVVTGEDAELLVDFVAFVLRTVYELPSRLPTK